MLKYNNTMTQFNKPISQTVFMLSIAINRAEHYVLL